MFFMKFTGLYAIMEKKLEATMLLGSRGVTYRGYIGIMEKTMETTIYYLGLRVLDFTP